MTKLIAFNKPYDVLCQFTDQDNRKTLADYIDLPGVYTAGRLDRDSEGLVLLTDNGRLQNHISHPKFKTWKTYWAQVEGTISEEAINKLSNGITLKDGPTKPAKARQISEPENLWPRTPPIRYRANIPTSWLELSIREGRNRQVRRMTAAVGYPTLRLIRYAIGELTIQHLEQGNWKEVQVPRKWRMKIKNTFHK